MENYIQTRLGVGFIQKGETNSLSASTSQGSLTVSRSGVNSGTSIVENPRLCGDMPEDSRTNQHPGREPKRWELVTSMC